MSIIVFDDSVSRANMITGQHVTVGDYDGTFVKYADERGGYGEGWNRGEFAIVTLLIGEKKRTRMIPVEAIEPGIIPTSE